MLGIPAGLLFTPSLAAPPKLRGFFPYAVAGLALLALAFWFWSGRGEQRAVRALPAPERRALYERTLVTLNSPPCNSQKSGKGLRDFCRKQAEFIVEFPECDRPCAEQAKGILLDNPAR